MGTTRDLANQIRLIANVLERAEGLGDTPEADLMRAKAEQMMKAYRIDEETLIASQREAGVIEITPEWSSVTVTRIASEFREYYADLWRFVATHVGIRQVLRYGRDSDGEGAYLADACGYAGDLRYAEALFTSARLKFREKLEPSVDPSLSDEENCYRMRSAGMTRGRIAILLWGEESSANNGRVAKLYKAACAKRGEDAALNGRQANAGTYREVYAREFVNELWRRMKRAQENAGGQAVEFVGRIDRINETFYGRYPSYRPVETAVEVAPKPCERCEKRKAKGEGPCREHKPRAWSKADEARWQRYHGTTLALRAKDAGRDAASEVELHGAEKSAAKLDDSGPVSAVRPIES